MPVNISLRLGEHDINSGGAWWERLDYVWRTDDEGRRIADDVTGWRRGGRIPPLHAALTHRGVTPLQSEALPAGDHHHHHHNHHPDNHLQEILHTEFTGLPASAEQVSGETAACSGTERAGHVTGTGAHVPSPPVHVALLRQSFLTPPLPVRGLYPFIIIIIIIIINHYHYYHHHHYNYLSAAQPAAGAEAVAGPSGS